MRMLTFISSTLIISSLLLSGPQASASEQSPLLLGVSKKEITPAFGTPLAGYGRYRCKPTSGTHDPLFARALTLSHGDKTFIFVSLDLVLVDEALRTAILKKIKQRTHFKDEQLLLFATHTHTGSGTIG